MAHGALLALVLLLGALAARKAIQPEVPILEILPTDLQLTMGNQIGGGTPNPLPPGTKEVEGRPPQRSQAPPEVPRAAEPPPLPVPRTPDPPAPSKPAPKAIEKPDPPKTAPPKVEAAPQAKPVVRAQDVDRTRPQDKPVAPVADKAPPAPRQIEVSTARRKRTDDDSRAAAEAAESATAAARAREQRLASARNLAERLSGAASGVSRNVGATTQIQMPGPGGAAYAPYYSYLQAFLKQQWRKPATSTEREAQTTVRLAIARDGTILAADITRRSGVKALDTSVEELFRRLRKLRPLPDAFTETRMEVPVSFVLESDSSL